MGDVTTGRVGSDGQNDGIGEGGGTYLNGVPRIVWTLGLVFFTTFVTQMLATGFNVFDIDVSALQAAANSAIAAVLAFAINYFAPWIDQYGVSKE